MYIFNFEISSIGWLGGKYDDLLGKNANIRERAGKTETKGEIFTVLGVGGWGA